MSDDFRPYQTEDATKLASRARGYLAHDPGLGKTRTAILAAKLAGFRRIAVVAPAVVTKHWLNEAALVAPDLEVKVESYQRYVVSEPARLAMERYDALLFDEAQMLRSRDSQRSKLLLGSKAGLASTYRIVWPISGTPMPRHPGELYPILMSLWPAKVLAYGIKSYMEWLNHFTWYRLTKYGPRVYAGRNTDQLKLLLADVLIRRLAKEAGLPKLRFGTLTVNAPDIRDVLAEQGALDPAILRMIEQDILPNSGATSEYGAMSKLLHAIGDVKAHAVVDLVRDELESDEKATRVIFAYHHSVMDTIEKGLAPYGVARIDGKVTPSAASKQMVVNMLRVRGSRRVLVAQIQAAGIGLDGLQHFAHESINVEPSWNSDNNVQAARRLARLGQTMPSQSRFIALAGTVDEALVRNHYREAKMRKEAIDAED